MLKLSVKNISLFILVFFLFHISIPYGFAQQTAQQSLLIGDRAPTLVIEKWLNGERIVNFDPGRIYLLEFGSISCGPCRAAMPHLNQIAERFADRVTVISIYVLENGSRPSDTVSTAYVFRVEKFIENISSKMKLNYSVAVDGPSQAMFSSYLTASSDNSIPISFIVDGTGRIAWKGQPLFSDEVIEDLLSDKSIVAGEPTLLEKKCEELFLGPNSEDREFKQSRLILVDSLISVHSDLYFLCQKKFSLLLDLDEPDAYQYGHSLLNSDLGDDGITLLAIANEINARRATLKEPDWDLAIALTRRSEECTKDALIKVRTLTMESELYYNQGRTNDARQSLIKAIAFLGFVEDVDKIRAIRENLESKLHMLEIVGN